MEIVKNLQTKELDEGSLPSVSVVVPAFNSEKSIGETIKSLKKMDYPQDKLEIIVIDDASTDKTAQIGLHYGVKVVRRKKRGGCATAKNTGVVHAKNEIVAFIDADVMVTKSWLRELVAPFEDPAVGATGGLIMNKFRRNSALERYIDYDNLYRKRKSIPKSVSGANSAYRREVFNVVGNLDPYLGEDPDFPYRVLSHGYKMIFTRKAIVYHPFPNTVFSYFKKQVYYAWQRMLIFLLRPSCRTALVRDEITPLTFLLQPLVLAVMIFSLSLTPLFDQFKFVFLFLFALLMILNVPFLHYIYTKEAKLLLFGLLILIPRSFTYIIGMASGVASFIKVKIMGKTS